MHDSTGVMGGHSLPDAVPLAPASFGHGMGATALKTGIKAAQEQCLTSIINENNLHIKGFVQTPHLEEPWEKKSVVSLWEYLIVRMHTLFLHFFNNERGSSCVLVLTNTYAEYIKRPVHIKLLYYTFLTNNAHHMFLPWVNCPINTYVAGIFVRCQCHRIAQPEYRCITLRFSIVSVVQ